MSIKTFQCYNSIIELSGSSDEEWRYPRLHNVIGYVHAMIDVNGLDILPKLSRLDDHKGTLSVYWKESPTTLEMKIISDAWDSAIGDGCDNVDHYFHDQKLKWRDREIFSYIPVEWLQEKIPELNHKELRLLHTNWNDLKMLIEKQLFELT